MSEIDLPLAVGSRVVVTGMAGAGKSTFSRALSAKTGLPVIHLDLHSWNPGWVRTPEDEFREKQRALLAGENWIVDGNDAIDLGFERADTLVFLEGRPLGKPAMYSRVSPSPDGTLLLVDVMQKIRYKDSGGGGHG